MIGPRLIWSLGFSQLVLWGISFYLIGVFGGATGLLTITRGTLPLVLFDHATYGARIGKLLVPSFLISAASPLAFAYVIDNAGVTASLYCALTMAIAIFICSITLKRICPSLRKS